MAKIVGIHGIGHQFKGEHSVGAEWLPAIKDGLARAGRQLSSDSDFVCAFYGDLFRPSGKVAMDPPYDSSDVNDEWELEMLETWWREAARVDPSVRGPDARTKVRVPSIVQRALDNLSQSRFFAGLAERAMIYDLKQVRQYLRVQDIRQKARARVEKAVSAETRVMVGHSLGSVVAYEALCANPDWQIDVLITLGSPLGISNLIFDLLDPAPENGTGVWPAGLQHWINIADGGDVVALVKQLGSRFGSRVADHLIYNGASAHDATRYLTTKELGDAIAIGL